MLMKYEQQERDFVFLIDQQSPLDLKRARQMNRVIIQIFDNHIQPNDRVCLIKCGRESYPQKIFSLV